MMADSQGPLLPLLGPDPHAPARVHLMGRYALGVDWQDNHGSIFPFEFLRSACPCPACLAGRAAGAPPARGMAETWPDEIKRESAGIRIRWQDGHATTFGGRELRQLCRCVTCAK